MRQLAVFLDRDGVLNESLLRDNLAFAPLNLEEFKIYDCASAQIQRLKEAGYLCILFTNQPDYARGLLSKETLNEMHRLLRKVVPLDDIYVCPHDDADACECRKPKPGMLLEAAKKWKIDLTRSYTIGDRWRDIDAGRAAQCRTILIQRSYSRCDTADINVSNLIEAVGKILGEGWIYE